MDILGHFKNFTGKSGFYFHGKKVGNFFLKVGNKFKDTKQHNTRKWCSNVV